ncbi:TRAP transporter small permease [Frigidibacter sp. ROC022]|uniref:TRAP transporter small permease n=1 Tax=Frigidibacter sp. ROC022 TaxID=2971796 RepID=UPI00215B56DD|nr:TRAP transporter small permease [Frigidibacter sp. ROC022]MCR8725786.1 TRAP transporter small permease [Frigidibacter sp. ROC022]
MWKSIEAYLGAVLALAALLLFLSGMVLRLISSPLSGGWIQEITTYLVAWALLISSAACVANGEHIRADFFLRLTGPRFVHFANILASLAGLAFCIALTWFGTKVVAFALAWDERGPSFLQIPTAWFYAALPVSMAACSIRYVVELVSLIRRGPMATAGEV